jgi:hypothetical protein
MFQEGDKRISIPALLLEAKAGWEGLRENAVMAVLDNQKGRIRKAAAFNEMIESVAEKTPAIGGIDKDKIEERVHLSQAVEISCDVITDDPRALLDAKQLDVFPNDRYGFWITIHENAGGCPPRERFQAEGTRTGVEIEYPGTFRARSDDVEYRSSQPAAGRPGASAGHRGEFHAFIGACNDLHDRTCFFSAAAVCWE